jgi:hypothetical protein
MPLLIQPLPDGPLDIIGDVHGEIDALLRLLHRLGCDPARRTVTRPLVFVGDLIDRGPDSPAVVSLVKRLMEAGVAHCVVGNHELNLLQGLEKEGNGWFRGDGTDGFQRELGGVVQHLTFDSVPAHPEMADDTLDFLASLPLAMVREDLRVVHACWRSSAVASLPAEGEVAPLSREWAIRIRDELRGGGQLEQERQEIAPFANLKRLDVRPTHDLPAHAEVAEARQCRHPIKALTSGLETRVLFDDIFFVGGKWRFVRRLDWWNQYDEAPAVVVGHYWRRRAGAMVEGKPDPWNTPRHTDWAGPRRNVFCVDYSVGRRFAERAVGRVGGFDGGLAALRWPERELVFDDQSAPQPTTNWGGGAG